MSNRQPRRPQTATPAPQTSTQNVLSSAANAPHLDPAAVHSAIVQIADYQPHPRNYNRHPERQIEAIAASLRTFGQPRPVAVWRGHYLAGHGVVEAAKRNGWTTIRADILPDDYPEHLALAYVAADNELARLSDPDEAALAAILQESREVDPELLAAMGYTDKEYKDLLRRVIAGKEAAEDRTNLEAADALRDKWQTAPGQIWLCGQHRIMCGDSTNPAHVARLFAGECAAFMFSDPPYNVKIEYLSEQVDDDRSDLEYVTFTRAWFDLWRAHSDRQAISPGFNNLVTWAKLYGDDIHMIAPWIKRNGVTRGYVSKFACWEPLIFFGEADQSWEPILFVDGDTEPKPAKWQRMRVTDVFEYPIGQSDPINVHPCPKPLKMVIDLINSYSDIGDLVCDAFGGSGTTLIAAEETARRAVCMEIEPRWLASALERYKVTFGDTPILLEPAP